MSTKDYAFIKAANWTKEEETTLYEYVMQHGIASNCIDWSKIKEVFPTRTLAECSSKLFRMRQETDKYNFKRDIRRIRRMREEQFVAKASDEYKLSIEILINALMTLNE